uniref:Prokaryotic-type class I peptide chain release factors domain-containing protein n=1 Tax=Polytomella parva TaxID=51329 RepID=A0A7S0VI13_9CHLO|mmetsp:Transcript_32631/g.59177  ORF Transcript_32631/g.59177 Transcript_32631/m.59177 type:complete len:459 (+) Transcript_32631:197-1573(+)
MRTNFLIRASYLLPWRVAVVTKGYSPLTSAPLLTIERNIDALCGHGRFNHFISYSHHQSQQFSSSAYRSYSNASTSSSKNIPKEIVLTESLRSHLDNIKRNHLSLEAIAYGTNDSSDESGQTTPSISVSAKRKATREHARLQPYVSSYDEYLALFQEFEDLESVESGDDREMREMVAQERRELHNKLVNLKQSLLSSLLTDDPENDRNVILEVRAAAGGDEATLFAAELLDMYRLYSTSRGWDWSLLEYNTTEVGGVKLASASVSGEGAYGALRYECGVHRVQRVPRTETQGRIHTSTASVAVLPEAEEIDVSIRQDDVRVDTMRASGAGGQHVNVTDSAVRLTHIPTGIVINCQQERSQLKNMAMAWKLLRSKIYDLEQQKASQKMRNRRSALIGSGDRNERIRTYNTPQDRMTDHRVGFTCNNLDEVMDGLAIDKLAKLVREKEQNDELQAMGALD